MALSEHAASLGRREGAHSTGGWCATMQLGAAILSFACGEDPRIAESGRRIDSLAGVVRDLGAFVYSQATSSPASVSLGADPRRVTRQLGDPTAPLIIVEYTDYTCPHCQDYARQTWPRVRSRYVDGAVVSYVVMWLPTSHRQASHSAVYAAYCASEQGSAAFRAMHDSLFATVAGLESTDRLVALGEAIGLDERTFMTCLRAPETADRVSRDSARARSLGVEGTPTFLIGRVHDDRIDGTLFRGPLPASAFAVFLDSFTNHPD